MTHARNGFTVIEVIIAIMILSVGIIALVSTAAMATRMMGQGQRYTEAAQMANRRFEILRSVSCDSLAGGTATSGNFTERWSITAVGTGGQRLNVAIQSPTSGGFRADSFSSTRFC
jgi:prepilin-type N-terminal cleavage/methylation domain-containing protein